MISAISWVPKGASKPVPTFADPPKEDEIKSVLKTHDDDSDSDRKNDADIDIADAECDASIAEALKELNMDKYDEEDDDLIHLYGSAHDNLYYSSNSVDPYLKNKQKFDDSEDDSEDDDSEEEDMVIRPDNGVIICAKSNEDEDESDILEVWVLEEGPEFNKYLHHAIVLPEYPLSLAWSDCPIKGGERGNFAAVGTIKPEIEIWDLDVIDEFKPSATLSGHTDSVLALAWNHEFRNVLASASSDKLVKIWDVVTKQCVYTLQHHSDKVQAVAWNHLMPTALLSGSFDRSVFVHDARSPALFQYGSLAADVESLAWDPQTEGSFVVSLENGTVCGFDQRAGAEPRFTIGAHNDAVTSVSYNRVVPNVVATGSTDGTVKLWDLSKNRPLLVATWNAGGQAVFSVSFSEDFPFVLAIGGSNGELQIWDTMSDNSVSSKYRGFG